MDAKQSADLFCNMLHRCCSESVFTAEFLWEQIKFDDTGQITLLKIEVFTLLQRLPVLYYDCVAGRE
jgi:hypothetical protein